MAKFLGKSKLFPAIEDVDEVITDEWIEVSTDTVKIVEMMGAQFKLTKDDMEGNIKKVKDKFETDKEKFKKFKDILQDEKDSNKNKADKSATVGGLWLKRGLEYLCELFAELVGEHENSKLPGNKSDNAAVRKACEKAYENTLKNYHGMITKGVVWGALKISPGKETLLTNLKRDGNESMTDDQFFDEMKVYEAALREYIVTVNKLFKGFNVEDKGIPSGKVVQESS